MITEYSGRDLSLFADRLPAIAGIAKELGDFWHDTYFAGLWGNILLEHLGWARSSNKSGIERFNNGSKSFW